MNESTLKSLRRSGFPTSSRSVLFHISSMLEGKEAVSSAEECCKTLLDEFLFFRHNNRHYTLSGVEELCVLELLLKHLESQKSDKVRNATFCVVFNDERNEFLLGKLTSLAVSLRCGKLLNCVADWMQRKGCNSGSVSQVCETLVTDYKLVNQQLCTSMKQLPEVSSHFTCQFVTSLTTYMKHPGDSGLQIPTELLRLIVLWCEQQPLVLVTSLTQDASSRSSLWTSPSKQALHTPVPGLVRWCTMAPFAMMSQDLTETSRIWSQLHLATLRIIMAFPTLQEATAMELMTLADVKHLVRSVTDAVKIHGIEDRRAQVALDRVAQVLQVAVARGGFRCSMADLERIFASIPNTPLLEIMKLQHFNLAPPTMHTETTIS